MVGEKPPKASPGLDISLKHPSERNGPTTKPVGSDTVLLSVALEEGKAVELVVELSKLFKTKVSYPGSSVARPSPSFR